MKIIVSSPTTASRTALRRWQGQIVRLFNPYRPERHYMRGPGPKWFEKHGLPGKRILIPTAFSMGAQHGVETLSAHCSHRSRAQNRRA